MNSGIGINKEAETNKTSIIYNITLPGSVMTIGENAFINQAMGIDRYNYYVALGLATNFSNTTYVFNNVQLGALGNPSKLTMLGANAFKGRSDLLSSYKILVYYDNTLTGRDQEIANLITSAKLDTDGNQIVGAY